MPETVIKEFIAYLQVEKKYSPKTCIAYENDLVQFAIFLTTTYELNDLLLVKHHPVRAWIVHLMSESMMSTSVNRKISSLRSFFNWAIKKKKIDINPMLKVTSPKKPKKLPEVVPGNNIMRLFERSLDEVSALDSFVDMRDRFILELFYATGMRRAELKNIRAGDIDIKRQEIRVLGKGNKVRSIPLTESVIHMYQKYMEWRSKINNLVTDVVFVTENGKPIYEKLIYSIVRSRLAGITTLSKKSPHVLRHTFATHMLDEGADLNAIKELLGHASLAATQVYTHNSITKLKEVYKKAHPEG